MERFMGNRSHYHSSAFNTNGTPGPYGAAFLVPQNGSISATSSESSLASGLSDAIPTSTAASGNGTWRRFGIPSESNGGFGARPERWNESQTALDDLALYERPYSGPWSCLDYHTRDNNGGRFDSMAPTSYGSGNSPSNPDRDSPLFYSLAPIQSGGCSTVCPGCRSEVGSTNNNNSTSQLPASLCTCTVYPSSRQQQQQLAEPIAAPNHRFGSYLDQHTPTKLVRTPSVAHTPFPSLVLSRVGPTDPIGGYYEPRHDPGSPGSHSLNGTESDLTGLGSPTSSTSGMELSGDIRAVNLVSHDQLPLRTWI